MLKKYCDSLIKYSRWKTREVLVGKLGIGGDNPIRVQSMTTTDTMNTKATVEECIRMINAGCELIRITFEQAVPPFISFASSSII